ncbi:NAD(P)H-dependent oxidoreductase [Pacificibacter marinus]|uniref:Glutathione-regulated potassium-efflux system ancillary protein KefF n=1 Tax=Pacificibacter marinus TaxID=658057 RepID=A0A1Y5RGR8_9RHOB|nr:NAD(P)H-dependent oxidoreductase [Pacificibacter marinus]SEK21861.1 Putative NADPH-quinone reductase (modulator of drug activity B) [Pacificibacter marinus]SLN15901.1 Glutathione-regulated potassium-efflux system ancillary protein KefF [Pacificibacter marinus]
MKALVVYCHPRTGSFNAAIRDLVVARLEAQGVEYRLRDLYAEGFDPTLSPQDHEFYETVPENRIRVERDCNDLEWCDALIFVYPTWWYGLPAMLKGWLDRAMVPGVAFIMPENEGGDIKSGLTHITKLGVFTTCGASRWLTFFVGAPGKRTLMRGVRLLLAKRCKTAFAAQFLMDSATPESRAQHLKTVAARLDKLIRA